MPAVNCDPGSLSYCRFDGETILLKHFPEFLIIGPQRTGTTWLAENLRVHPQILMSKPKELFFFNLLKREDHFQYRSNNLSWYLKHFHVSRLDRARAIIGALRKHGRPYLKLVRGEATASYAAETPPEIVDEILKLNPDIKVILTIRNPILRAWSHAKKDLLNKSHINPRERTLNETPFDEMRDFMTDGYQLACADYETMIETWGSRLKRGHLFIGFFDDIHERPLELLQEVSDFLGVDSRPRLFDDRSGVIFSPTDKKGQNRPLPPAYKEFLESLFISKLCWLQDRFKRDFRY